MKHIECVVVGDDIAEMRNLMVRYVTSATKDYMRLIDYSREITVDGQLVDLQLSETGDNEEFSKLFLLMNKHVDVFIVAFALISPTSLDRVESVWVPGIRENYPDTPYILVGTHMNDRDNFDQHKDEYESKGWKAVPTSLGKKMRKKMNAKDYVECDEDLETSLDEAFTKAAKVGLGIDLSTSSRGSRDVSQHEEKSEMLTIGLYNNESNDSKIKIGLNYILGEFHDGNIPIDRTSFFKEEYIDGKYVNVTINIDNQHDLKFVNAMLFILDVGVGSIKKLKSLFDEIQKTNTDKIPYVLALNYESEKQENAISDQEIDEIIRDFQCKVFEIKNYSKDDIEDVFFYLNQRMDEQISSRKKQKKRQLKKKIKSKS